MEKLAGTIIEVELEGKHNRLVWGVEVVTTENKVMEVHIEAETGSVIDGEEEKVMPKQKRSQTREHDDAGNWCRSYGNEN